MNLKELYQLCWKLKGVRTGKHKLYSASELAARHREQAKAFEVRKRLAEKASAKVSDEELEARLEAYWEKVKCK